MSKRLILAEKPTSPTSSQALQPPLPIGRGPIHFAPFLDLPYRFAAGAERAMECAVLRPIDLSQTHGVNVTAEDIDIMAADYDPAFEAGALNFDHAWGGPAHGLAPRIWKSEGFLWCRMAQLSEEAVAGILSGQWPRRSSEFWMSHPQTDRPYWCGLALLGAATPAVPGLPPVAMLSQRPIYRLVSIDAAVAASSSTSSAAAEPASTGSVVEPSVPGPSKSGVPSKEEAMKKKTAAAPAGAESETPETPTPETPETAVKTPEGDETPETPPATPAAPASASATPAQLAAATKELRTELEAARNERIAAKQERAEVTVDKLFTKLGTRCTPAVTKAARPLLVALAALLTPATVKLSVGGKEVDSGIYESMVTILEAMPEAKFVNNERRAENTDPEGVATRSGLTAERRAELAAKYPGSYETKPN